MNNYIFTIFIFFALCLATSFSIDKAAFYEKIEIPDKLKKKGRSDTREITENSSFLDMLIYEMVLNNHLLKEKKYYDQDERILNYYFELYLAGKSSSANLDEFLFAISAASIAPPESLKLTLLKLTEKINSAVDKDKNSTKINSPTLNGRTYLIECCEKYSWHEAIPFLLECLSSKDEKTKVAAKEALKKLEYDLPVDVPVTSGSNSSGNPK
jgi:hypothetical protein